MISLKAIAVVLLSSSLTLLPNMAMAQNCSEGLVAAEMGNNHIDMSTIKGAPGATVHVLRNCAKTDVGSLPPTSGRDAIREALRENAVAVAALKSMGYTPTDVLGAALIDDSLNLFVAAN